MSSDDQEPRGESPFSLTRLRDTKPYSWSVWRPHPEDRGELFVEIKQEALLALIDIAEAARSVAIETLTCPVGHLDNLEIALSKFDEDKE